MAARRLWIVLACVVMLGCGDDSTDPPRDSQAPRAVVDLSAVAWSPSRIELRWTAPGEDGQAGAAAAGYDLRYASSPITSDSIWEGAVPLPVRGSPKAAGETESLEPSGLPADRPLYFAIKAVDGAGNWSAISNPAVLDGYLAPITITNVLRNLERSYEERNHAEYVALFSDDYVFEFDPSDVANGDNIPGSGLWGLADENLSAQNMLSGMENRGGYRGERIALDFSAGDPEPSDRNALWSKVTLANVSLQIDTVHSRNGTLTYLVQGDQAILHLVQTTEVDASTQQPTWKIAYWKDQAISLALPSIQQISWGQVKALWR